MTTRPAGRRGLVTGGLLAACLTLVHMAAFLLPSLFLPLRHQATDRLFALRQISARWQTPYDGTVAFVDIDDRSLAARQDFYLGRPEHARLIRNLSRAGVAAQFHDVIFAAPLDESGDAELEEATTAAGNVYYGMALGLAPPPAAVGDSRAGTGSAAGMDAGAAGVMVATRHFLTIGRLADAAAGMGFLDLRPDLDGVYRRAPLLALDGGKQVPSQALLVACRYLGVNPDDVRREDSWVILPGARRGGRPAADIRIPVDRFGRMVVNFPGPWGSMEHFPFHVIFDASDDRFMMEDLRTELEGRIAVVTWVATGAEDIGPVPTDPLYPRAGIHASVINGILAGAFLREAGSLWMLLAVELPLLLVLLAAALRLSSTGFVAVAALLLLGYGATAAAVFLEAGLILDLPGPLLTLALSTMVLAAYNYHLESSARAVLRSTFDAYFPSTVVDKVMSQAGGLQLAAQRKELTILFSDIQAFTRHTASMEPEHVRTLLNEYFAAMVEIVFRHGGTVDKFIGDGLMVFFGDPEEQPDHARRCAHAAVEMQGAAAAMDRRWRARGDMPLVIRIGIHTGAVMVGNMGSDQRLSYTVLGEAVNLAQRLESAAPPAGILISAQTHACLAGAPAATPLEPVTVKGFEQPIPVYLLCLPDQPPDAAIAGGPDLDTPPTPA